MQSFTAWVRWIVGGIFTLIILPQVGKVLDHMAENYGWYDREALPNAINIFLSLAERTWLRVTALVLGGFVAGMLVDLFLRKLDGSRADTIKLFGAEMVKLGNYVGQLKSPMQESARIKSCFATARKLGLWVPDERIFRLHPPRASQEISNYLMQVGTMLKDGNFREAKQDAKNSKAAFDKAYAQHRLT
jgi:hypothetical protein